MTHRNGGLLFPHALAGWIDWGRVEAEPLVPAFGDMGEFVIVLLYHGSKLQVIIHEFNLEPLCVPSDLRRGLRATRRLEIIFEKRPLGANGTPRADFFEREDSLDDHTNLMFCADDDQIECARRFKREIVYGFAGHLKWP